MGQTNKYKKIFIQRLNKSGKLEKFSDLIVIEKTITLIVKNHGKFNFLCTPINLKELVIGYLFYQKIIDSVDEILSISEITNLTNTLKVSLKKSKAKMIRAKSFSLKSSFIIDNKFLQQIILKLQIKQSIFQKTGATHAAGIFNSQGKIITFGEDIARHNALDKAIGSWLLLNKPPAQGIVLSGRISYEMIAKVVRSGIKLVLAVSAPSSLAIETAKKHDITLYGFVRNGQANLYAK